MLEFYIGLLKFHCLIGLVIEEINEEDETVSSDNNASSSTENLVAQSQKTSDSSRSQNLVNNGGLSNNAECLQALKDNPEAIRYVSFVRNFHVI